MAEAKIPVTVVADAPFNRHARCDVCVTAVIPSVQVLTTEYDSETLERLVIVHICGMSKYNTIAAALLIRNSDHSPIVGIFEQIPPELLSDIYNRIVQSDSVILPLETEALVSQEALDVLGNIDDEIDRFEREFLQ